MITILNSIRASLVRRRRRTAEDRERRISKTALALYRQRQVRVAAHEASKQGVAQ